MSAFLVTNRVLSSLATFACDHGLVSDPVKALAMLKAENLRSLRARYSDISDESKVARKYRFEPVQEALGQVCEDAACYGHQACESDDYETTKAAKLIAAIESKLESMGARRGSGIWDK